MRRDEPADRIWERMRSLRHSIHREPETGLDLPRTQQKVLEALAGLPLEVTTGRSLSSVTAVLRGNVPGKSVLLRADMDALMGTEKTNVRYASSDPSRMHACGHDIHTAALVGAAHVLAESRESLSGDVVFMFQPGEEGYGGARLMVEEGVLDAAGSRVSAAYALHVTSSLLPQGWVASRAGTLMAAADLMRVTVIGSGGHGSQPHTAQDPVVGAAAMVVALQTLVTREFDVFDPVILNVGVFRAGSQHNVIPDRAEFEVSIRSFSVRAREAVINRTRRTVEGIAAAHGLKVEVELEELYPVLATDPSETEFALGTARAVVGEGTAFTLPNPVTASEDFTFVLDHVPGAYLFLGACPAAADPGTAAANHASNAVFDDAVMPTAARLLAELAARRLATSTLSSPQASA